MGLRRLRALAGSLFFVAFFGGVVCRPAHARYPAVDEISVDIPEHGQGVVVVSRQWVLNRFLRGGVFAGGGVVQRTFHVTDTDGTQFDVRTRANVLPFLGPRVTLHLRVVALSVAVGAFWSRVKTEAVTAGGERLDGVTRGWGTGVYAPLFVVDFYDKRRNCFFGIGIGGLLGVSGPELSAAGAGRQMKTTASPLDSLTLHLRMRWAAGHPPQRRAPDLTL